MSPGGTGEDELHASTDVASRGRGAVPSDHGAPSAASARAAGGAIDRLLVAEVEREMRRDDVDLTLATPDDYADIEAASRGAHEAGDVRTQLSAERIAWFVDHNPCGPGFVVIARAPGERRVLGHFVFYPWRLKLRDAAGRVREIPVYVHVRLWVSRALRRRGVFLSMARFGLALLRRLGVGLAYTVPNPRSAPGFLQLGEELAGELPLWVRPLLPGWSLLGGRYPRGIEVEQRDAFDTSFDAFDAMRDASMPGAATAWSPRRSVLLDWRFVRRPGADYQIRYLQRGGSPVGYLVTRRMRIGRFRTLVVCDQWTAPGEERALRAGIDDAGGWSDRAAVAVAFGGNVADTVRPLREAAFIPCPRPLQPQPVPIVGGAIGGDDLRVELPSFDGWFLTPCDWDVF